MEKDKKFQAELDNLMENMKNQEKAYVERAMEKVASSWLSALLIKSIGYILNKQELGDAIHLRYGWEVEGIPEICVCKEEFIDHFLICKHRGYTSLRHNSLRDIVAQIMKEVCRLSLIHI